MSVFNVPRGRSGAIDAAATPRAEKSARAEIPGISSSERFRAVRVRQTLWSARCAKSLTTTEWSR